MPITDQIRLNCLQLTHKVENTRFCFKHHLGMICSSILSHLKGLNCQCGCTIRGAQSNHGSICSFFMHSVVVQSNPGRSICSFFTHNASGATENPYFRQISLSRSKDLMNDIDTNQYLFLSSRIMECMRLKVFSILSTVIMHK